MAQILPNGASGARNWLEWIALQSARAGPSPFRLSPVMDTASGLINRANPGRRKNVKFQKLVAEVTLDNAVLGGGDTVVADTIPAPRRGAKKP